MTKIVNSMNENEYEMCLTHLNYIAIGNTYIISCAVELSILFHTFFCVIITMIIFIPRIFFVVGDGALVLLLLL